MANKTKRRDREQAAKTGMSHQAVVNQRRASTEGPRTNSTAIVVRSFDTKDRGYPFSMRGEIRGGRFVLYFERDELPVSTLRVGHDKRGPYAVLVPSKTPLPDGRVVEVGVQFDPPLMDDLDPDISGEIHVYRPATLPDFIKAALPGPVENFNLVIPHEESFSVSFDLAGKVDGAGYTVPVDRAS